MENMSARVRLLSIAEADEENAPLMDEENTDRLSQLHEKMMEICGFGPYQVFLAIVMGVASMVAGSTLHALPIMLIATQEDFNMTSSMQGIYAASIPIGMTFGGFIEGYLGDTCGRKQALVSACLIQICLSITAAIPEKYAYFVILQFLNGLVQGGILPLATALLGEMCTTKHRGKILSSITFGENIGSLYVAIVAYKMIRYMQSKQETWIKWILTWRGFWLVTNAPIIATTIAVLFVDESPLYLLQSNECKQALSAYKRIERWNKRTPVIDEEVEFCLKSLVKRADKDDQTRTSAWKVHCNNFLSRLYLLFSRRLCKTTNYLSLMCFTTYFAYGIIINWVPEVIYVVSLAEERANTTRTTFHSLVESDKTTLPRLTKRHDMQMISLMLALTSFPKLIGTLAGGWAMDRLGRIVVQLLSAICSAAIILLMWWFDQSSLLLTLLYCVYSLSGIVQMNATRALQVESFPVYVRTTGAGYTQIWFTLGAVTSSLYVGLVLSRLKWVMIAPIVAHLLSALTVIPLPETKDALM